MILAMIAQQESWNCNPDVGEKSRLHSMTLTHERLHETTFLKA